MRRGRTNKNSAYFNFNPIGPKKKATSPKQHKLSVPEWNEKKGREEQKSDSEMNKAKNKRREKQASSSCRLQKKWKSQ